MATSDPSDSDTIYPMFANTEPQINAFIRHLNSSKRILALCGAGLSASVPSSIPTFAGTGALWKNHKAAALSNIDTFEANPGLVWSYFADRRRLALKASVNEGHKALPELARKMYGKGRGGKKGKGGGGGGEFLCLTQNIDGEFVNLGMW